MVIQFSTILNDGETMSKPPRPYFDPTILRRKREAERAALLAELKRAWGFGKCKVLRASDAAIDNVRCFKREQSKA